MEKEIQGFEGLYKIYADGTVRRMSNANNQYKEGRKVKPQLNHSGYFYVQLFKNGKGKNLFVHRLVAKAFIENKDKKPFVNHKNGIKTDNSIENLEWVTSSENEKHSYSVLGKKAKRKLSNQQVSYIKNEYFNGVRLSEIANRYGLSVSAIWHIVVGNTYKESGGGVLKKGYAGENNGRAKLKNSDIPIIKKLREQGEKYQDIANKYNVSYQTISRACKK